MKPNSFETSLKTVLRHSRPLGSAAVSFHHALGRVLAENVSATADDPPAPKSAMDGFALRAADTAAAAGGSLDFGYSETVGAGHLARSRLKAGAALRIMTGALLPRGADAVVKLEDTRPAGEARFTLSAPLAAGENVVPAGARWKKGDTPLHRGEQVTAQALGLLAGLGRSRVQVYHQPRVALLALGDELVDVGRPLAPGKLYVSNLHALGARVARYGALARPLGIAEDNPELIQRLLGPRVIRRDGPQNPLGCEIVLTLGGSHGGDFDFAHQVLQALGATLHFHRTRTNLGGSTLFATLDGTLFFGLPGTPVPSWGAFELLVRPALWRLAGRAATAGPMVRARLQRQYQAQPGRTCFAPARLSFDPAGDAVAMPLRARGTAEEPPSLMANSLIHLPEGADRLEAGAEVRVEWLAD